MNFADAEERDALAGEYVLGLLTGGERAEFERELPRNRALTIAVHEWEERLWPVSTIAAPVRVSPALWAWIERDLGFVRATPRPDAQAPRAETDPSRARWWQSLAFWRTGALIATAAALVFALVPVLRDFVAPPVTYIAVLEAPDRSPGWIVQATAGKPVRLTPLVSDAVTAQQSLQFWTLIDKAQGPVSLGLVEPNRAKTVPHKSLPGLKEGQLFEITLEPYGGSPLKTRPSGKILYKGLTVAQ
jgi:anti-sigma-K factor RskA